MSEPQPIRIDYVFITVNKHEREGVRVVFDLPYETKESGLKYTWGYLSNSACIAHVNLRDNAGIGSAATVTSKICDVLYPSYIIVLGTAVGIHGEKKEGDEDRPEPGDIIVAKIIRYGTISEEHLKEQPIIQPDLELHEEVDSVIKRTKWLSDIKADVPERLKNILKERKIIVEELLTANEIIKNLHKDKKMLSVVKKYPRLVAIDMEVGAIGNKLFDNFSAGRWTPKLFVVKAVSDIADNRVHYRDTTNKIIRQSEFRKLSREYVTEASAAFAKDLVSNYKPTKRNPTPAERFLPERFHGIRNNNIDCSGVLYSIQPEEYSKIAAHLYDRLLATGNDNFFTVCAYDPKTLWDTAKRRYQHAHDGNSPADYKTLKAWTLNTFDHFKMFGAVANSYQKKDDHCIRIVILEGSTDSTSANCWTNSELKEEWWSFFCDVNQEVPCWGIGRYDLSEYKYDDKFFLTDYVIIGDKYLLDYYDESRTLIITDVYHEGTTEHYLGLKKCFSECKNSTESSPFKELSLLKDDAMRVFNK